MNSIEDHYHLERRDRRTLRLDDFTDADVEALKATRAPGALEACDNEPDS
jgi:hypothetical protein